MVDNEKNRPANRKDGPVEKPKKLPSAFPDEFDTEKKEGETPIAKKRGKGARFHGSM